MSKMLLPGRTQVRMPVMRLINDWDDIVQWFLKYGPESKRADVYAWATDDPLEHFHVVAFIRTERHESTLYTNLKDLGLWCEGIEACRGVAPCALVFFENASQAALFKLKWGGA